MVLMPRRINQYLKENVMRSKIVMSIAAVSLICSLSAPNSLFAQPRTGTDDQKSNFPRYKVIDLGSLQGSAASQPFSMNNRRLVGGSATLSNNTQHAALWSRGFIVDLGTLGGANSMVFGINAIDQAVGEAEEPTANPANEDFCGFGTHHTCAPFLWERGVMTSLATLGGDSGVANQINDSGVVSGFAENTQPDKHCPTPQIFEFKPVVWINGNINELPTIAGDPDGVALSANRNGQTVGASGTCAAFNSNTLLNLLPVHALLWDDGKAVDLGNLGGTTGQAGGNLAWAINDRGQVVGSSDLAGDATFHAFLWTNAARMKDLGTLPGDVASSAAAINERGDVVGISLDQSFNPHAFLWQDGVMMDLNALVPAKSSLVLLTACSVNSHREIAGLALTASGEFHAYLAIPEERVDHDDGP
jgi:probable HAF family extracellular repeat protein